MWNHSHEVEACILVNGKPITEVQHNGQIYVEGRNGTDYQLRLSNRTCNRLLVIPSVDGLSVLDGQSAGKESPGYVLAPYETVVIPGWKVNGAEAAKFVFKTQESSNLDEQTYVEAIGGDKAHQGIIGFMVFREKPPVAVKMSKNYERYRSAPNNPHDFLRGIAPTSVSGGVGPTWTFSSTVSGPIAGGWSGGELSNNLGTGPTLDSFQSINTMFGQQEKSAGLSAAPEVETSLGTGFGESTQFNTHTVTFERANHAPMVMAIIYDTLRNLKKKYGVPPELFRPAPPAQNPFPASPEVFGTGCRPPKNWHR